LGLPIRPREEWIVQTDESLRIVPQELWDRVRERKKQSERHHESKAHPKYLFSGLLVCGVCGAKYTMRDVRRYACAFNFNRGWEICPNGLTVKRETVERVLLKGVRQLFDPESLAYLTQRVNEALRDEIRRRQTPTEERERLESELQEALAELDNIRTAIKRGLFETLTPEMVSQAEERVRILKDRLSIPRPADIKALSVLPEVIQRRLQDLERVLGKDVDEARAILRSLLGEIILKPTPEGLKAQLRGNTRGLLTLDEQAPVWLRMVAGAGFEPATFGL
jgi:site-specific DNA recombinase